MDYFNDKEPRAFKERLIFATIVIFLGFFVLTIRLWYLQVISSSQYKELSKTNLIRITHSEAPRGIIYDRDGIRIAENRPGFDLSVIPEDITDWKKTKETLSRLLSIEEEVIEEQLKKAKKRRPFKTVKIKENLSWDDMTRVSVLNYELPGVIVSVAPKRNYPFSAQTAHLLGYLGEITEDELLRFKDIGRPYQNTDMTGKYGIESIFEKTLKGTDGGRQYMVDAVGREVKVLKSIKSYPGSNLRLSIDMDLQKIAFEAMGDYAGAVIAVDPNNGKILAMVSTPSFDPNLITTGITKKDWNEIISNPLHVLTNRGIQGQYPPASTFKVITATAALEEKIVTPRTKIFSGASFWFKKHEYRDWKASGHGKIRIHDAIVESSDTFFYQVGLKVGVDKLAEYSKSFGLGSKTQVSLLDEKSGLVPTSEWKKRRLKTKWYEGETVSVSVGQGYLLATPIQILNMYSAIANGGTLYTPQLVDRIETPEGKVLKEFTRIKKGRVSASTETIKLIQDALRGVVTEEKGTARRLNVPALKIAGKTGTAQVVRQKTRGMKTEDQPYKHRDHGLFVGYAPHDNPEIAIVVIVEHGGFGSKVAAPVALEVFKAYFEKNATKETDKKNKEPIIKVEI